MISMMMSSMKMMMRIDTSPAVNKKHGSEFHQRFRTRIGCIYNTEKGYTRFEDGDAQRSIDTACKPL